MKQQYIVINSIGTYYYSDKAMSRLHRVKGPACDCVNGTKLWYVNGRLHREDGPAIEYSNGIKIWYLNGIRHRENGPAFEWAVGKKWFLNNKEVTEEEHARLTKKVTTININGKEFTVEELNSLIESAKGKSV